MSPGLVTRPAATAVGFSWAGAPSVTSPRVGGGSPPAAPRNLSPGRLVVMQGGSLHVGGPKRA